MTAIETATTRVAVPVVALGILGEYVSPSVLMTLFAVAAAAGLGGTARALQRVGSPVVAVRP